MRLSAVIALATAGALVAPAGARADNATARSLIDYAFSGWGITAAKADEVRPKQGFFVGVHSGLVADSGVGPEVAGISIPLADRGTAPVMANGYYVYTTSWDIGTYVGGGFGQLNLGVDEYSKRRDYAYEGMAGLTYSFTPAMALGLEFRYSSADPLMGAQPLPNEADAQSVTLRFDFVLN